MRLLVSMLGLLSGSSAAQSAYQQGVVRTQQYLRGARQTTSQNDYTGFWFNAWKGTRGVEVLERVIGKQGIGHINDALSAGINAVAAAANQHYVPTPVSWNYPMHRTKP
jgi:hypothetical protein